MDTNSSWKKPAPQEHSDILRFIKHFRRKDIIMCTIFAVIGCLLAAAGVFAVIDRFLYAAGFFVAAVLFLIISLGCGLSDMDRYKIIRGCSYTVISCSVAGHSCTRTRYKTTYKVTVIGPDNKKTTHTVSGYTYRKAVTGVKALIVNYSSDESGKNTIPVDVVISDGA